MVIDFRKAHHTLRDRAESLFRPAIIRVYLLPQHSGDELEVVADTMLQLFRHHILFEQQRLPFRQQAILFDNQRSHLVDGRSQDGRSTRSRYRFSDHVGEGNLCRADRTRGPSYCRSRARPTARLSL